MRGQNRTRKQVRVNVALRGHRNAQAAPNSMKFMASIEGDREPDGAHIRSANGMRWKVQ